MQPSTGFQRALTKNRPERPPENVEFFHSLDPIHSRRGAFGASMAVHALILGALVVLPLVFTDSLKVKYQSVSLAPPIDKTPPPLVTTKWFPAPAPAPAKPPEVRTIVQPPIVQPPRRDIVPQPVKPLEKDPTEQVRIPKIENPQPLPAVLPVPRVVAELPIVAAAPPKAPVQTGGFGDSNGVAVKDVAKGPANIASLGAFDLPAGPGAGNGTGGSRGSSGIKSGTAFASAAPAGPGGGLSGMALKQSGFADAQPIAAAPARQKIETGPPDKPVEITFKPRPDYTDEARRLHLEGEVLVRVLFGANGQISIIDLVHGLGHGLDESAIRAAQQIRYKPAQREGKPVETTAIVHIAFQLAF